MKDVRWALGVVVLTSALLAWGQFGRDRVPISEVHPRRLEIGKTWIEVLGACTLRESGSVDCWGWDQRPSPNLTKNVSHALKATPGNGSFSVRPGKKNRLVVFRMERHWDGKPVVSEIGDGTTLWIHSEEWPGSNGQRFRIETFATVISADESAKFGVLRVGISETVPRVILKLKPGASIKGQLGQAKVVSGGTAGKGAPQIGNSPALGRIEISGSVSEQEVRLARFAGPNQGDLESPAYSSAARSDTLVRPLRKLIRPTPGGFEIWLSEPTSKVSALVFGGTRTRPVGIGEIPLDPLP